MLEELKSTYDVYVTAKYGNDCFKLLFADSNYANRDDYLRCASINDLAEINKDPRFHLRNVSCIPSGVYLSTFMQDTPESLKINDLIHLEPKFTVWDMLYDLINCNAAIGINDVCLPASHLSFSMKSDNVGFAYIKNGKHTHIVWTTPDLAGSYNCDSLGIECSLDFYTKWINQRLDISYAVSDLCINGDKVTFTLDLVKVVNTYDSIYACQRYYSAELAYLASKYLALKNYIYGIEIGYWFMNYINGRTVDLYRFIKPEINKIDSTIKFIFISDLPDYDGIVEYLKNVNVKSIPFLSWQICDLFSRLNLLKNNIYSRYFCDGLCSQINEDGIIRDYEYVQTNKLHTDLAALACRLFSYRLTICTTDVNIANEIPLADGILKVEEGYAAVK